jgi:hypothetical protein
MKVPSLMFWFVVDRWWKVEMGIWWGNPWGFESPLSHHAPPSSDRGRKGFMPLMHGIVVG